MKRLFALLLVFTMVAAMAAGCASTQTNETTGSAGETTNAPTTEAPTTGAPTTEPPAAGPESALEVLETIWAGYGDDEKFAAIGGSMDAPVDNAPGSFNIEDTESLTASLLVPADQIANIQAAASLTHMMNANTFTGAVYHMAEGADASAFADAMKDAVMNNQWMCGFPEKLVISVVDGEYVLVAYGVNDAMGPFETKLAAAYPDAENKYSEAIA